MLEQIEQFEKLLPVTLTIAGLPTSDHGKYFNEDQMDLRMRTILKAFKFAQMLMKELTEPQ